MDKCQTIPTDIFSNQLIYCYNRLKSKNLDTVDIMTTVLNSVHNFYYSQKHANRINHRQGRNRYVSEKENKEMMLHFCTVDNDEESTRQLIKNLNTYIKTNCLQKKDINKIKTLVIILLQSKAFDVLENLSLPDFIKPSIDKAYNEIIKCQHEILKGFENYLKDSGHEFLIEVLNKKGEEFWKNINKPPLRLFNNYFKNYKDKINNWNELYKMFLYYRGEYNNISNNIKVDRILKLFGILIWEYKLARVSFIKEFSDLIEKKDEENFNQIERIIYG